MADETAAGPTPPDEDGTSSPVTAALKRFWWLLVIGGVVGLIAAVSMVYSIPSFEQREARTYTAQARIFVTSPEGQYIRLSVPREVETGGEGRGGSGGGPAITQVPPNVEPLLAAANLYPLLIVSDEVTALRAKMFKDGIVGSVTANAFSAVSTPQRFAPAQIPVIDIFANSNAPGDAITLANTTADAFGRWIRMEQNRAGIKPAERIIIRELQVPQVALPSAGPSWGIPILVALAIAAAFGFLAVVLDQVYPRAGVAGSRPPAPGPPAEARSPSPRWS